MDAWFLSRARYNLQSVDSSFVTEQNKRHIRGGMQPCVTFFAVMELDMRFPHHRSVWDLICWNMQCAKALVSTIANDVGRLVLTRASLDCRCGDGKQASIQVYALGWMELMHANEVAACIARFVVWFSCAALPAACKLFHRDNTSRPSPHMRQQQEANASLLQKVPAIKTPVIQHCRV